MQQRTEARPAGQGPPARPPDPNADQGAATHASDDGGGVLRWRLTSGGEGGGRVPDLGDEVVSRLEARAADERAQRPPEPDLDMPPEPEILAAWRQLCQRRDALVRLVRTWERQIRHRERLPAEDDGDLAIGRWQRPDGEWSAVLPGRRVADPRSDDDRRADRDAARARSLEVIRGHLEATRTRLAALDGAIAGDKRLTLQQVRKRIADADHTTRAALKTAVVAWMTTDHPADKHLAEDRLRAAGATQADLVRLRTLADKQRLEDDGSGSRDRSALRILALAGI